jgi:hypothetical protein
MSRNNHVIPGTTARNSRRKGSLERLKEHMKKEHSNKEENKNHIERHEVEINSLKTTLNENN